MLPRWIEGRRGLPANRALLREFRDVAGRIAELIHWFHRADLVLEAVLGTMVGPLSDTHCEPLPE